MFSNPSRLPPAEGGTGPCSREASRCCLELHVFVIVDHWRYGTRDQTAAAVMTGTVTGVIRTRANLTRSPVLRIHNRSFSREVRLASMNLESDDHTRLREENSALRMEVRQLKRKLVDAAPSTAALSGEEKQPNDRRSAHSSRTVCEACEKLPPGTFTSGYGLNKDQIERYSRHLLLGSFGPARQASLCNSSVLIVGCGGLGSSAALYLTAAGVGESGKKYICRRLETIVPSS